MSGRRVHYIDWLRVLAVLLLFPFHSGRVFDVADPFYAKSEVLSVPITYLLAFIDRFHMPLLFMLAGMSTYFALRRRTVRQYAAERSARLLVPLAFGFLVIVPPQTWYGARTNAGYTGSFLDYVTSSALWSFENMVGRGDYYGGLTPAHLWFIMFLWVLSMLAIPLLAWGRAEHGDAALARWARRLARPGWWAVVVFLALLGDALPELGVSNPLYYFVYFVTGYVVMHDAAFAESAERWRAPALLAGLAISLVTVFAWRFSDSLPDPSAQLAAWAYLELAGGWLMLVGIIGYGRRLLDRGSPALAYLGEASYPVYILHQTVIVMIGFYLVKLLPQPALAWPLLVVFSAAATYALYEGARRVRALRFFLGMRPLQRD